MCYRNRLHVQLKQASFAIEAYFIQSRNNLPLPKRVFLSIFITKFCILVNLESSNENREFWASRILYFLFLIKRIPYSCTTIKLQSYDYIGYSCTTLELQSYNYRGYSCTTTEFRISEEISEIYNTLNIWRLRISPYFQYSSRNIFRAEIRDFQRI